MSDGGVHYISLFLSTTRHAPSTTQQFIKKTEVHHLMTEKGGGSPLLSGPVFGSGPDSAILFPDVLQAACLMITATLLVFFLVCVFASMIN